MINTEELYNIVKLPADKQLLDNLISKYLKISYKDMSNEMKELDELLYKQINFYSIEKNSKFNKSDADNFIKKINVDYSKYGKPLYQNGYRINPIARQPGWNTFQSWYLLGTEKISAKDISHRFYFGIPNEKLYELSNILYDKLKASNIPFYFKTDASGYERTDNIVLYTSTPLLKQTIKVIEKIVDERSDLIDNCMEPSIVTGKFSNKIGYASEDANAQTSHTMSMCDTFIESLNEALIHYKTNNRNSNIRNIYNQKIQEYLNSGKRVDLDRVKNRILTNLIKDDPSFNNDLLLRFKNKLAAKGFDINNACFNKRIKEEMDKYYNSEKILQSEKKNLLIQKEMLLKEKQNNEYSSNNHSISNKYGFVSIILASLIVILIAMCILILKTNIQ